MAASQLGQEHGAGAGGCRDGALGCVLTSGTLQIPNPVKTSAESPGSCGPWRMGLAEKSSLFSPFYTGLQLLPGEAQWQLLGFVLPALSPVKP